MEFNVSLLRPVVTRSADLSRDAAKPLLTMFALLTAWGVGYDLMVERMDSIVGLTFANSIVSIFMQIYATRVIAAAARPNDPRPNHFRLARLFGQSLLMGLGTLLGLLLVILPGIYVAARWFIAQQIVIMEDKGAVDAMSDSWERLDVHWATAAILALITIGMIIIPLIPLALETVETVQQPLLITLSVNAFLAFGFIASYVFATVIWLELSRAKNEATEIFG